MAVAIVAGALANKPGSGGEAWVRLSWVLGLRRLGWDVWFAERLASAEPGAIAYFESVVEEFGLGERAALLGAEGESLVGPDETQLTDLAAGAEVLFDISGHLGPGPLLASARRRIYVDLDPGFTQAWHADPSIEFSVDGYHHYFTVGQDIGQPACPVPTAGIEWVPTLPPVLLDEWPAVPAPAGPLRFTSVGTWRSPYGTPMIDGRAMSLKHHQFRRFAELPERVKGVELELALDIHPGDAADLELLREHGWKIVDPREVAATPDAFRDYVCRSGAEFSVAQGVYVEASTGWFSDRTAAYLASGCPAVVQDTGGGATLSTDGLQTRPAVVTFDDLDPAVAGIEAVRDDYEAHAATARGFAERHLDSDRVLSRVLEIALGVLVLALVPLLAQGPARAAASPPQVRVMGKPQVVFDWSRSACEEMNYPDLPTRAFRDYQGQTQLLISHFDNFRLVGPSLDRLAVDCEPVMLSKRSARPRDFADRQWIGSVFTRDGRTVWALVHDEYQGNRHRGRCPSGRYMRCWYNAVTLARSKDGGRTFQPARKPPRNLVAGPSFRYRPGIGPRGVFAPSNIVAGPGGAHYALVRVRDLAGQRGVCVIRSRRVSVPGSWRAWNGSGFAARFRDPYRSQSRRREPCRVVDPGQIAEMTESLTFNRTLGRYLLIGLAPPGPLSVGPKVRGIYYSTSADLMHWSARTLVAPALTKQDYRCGGRSPIAYPSVVDPGSDSRTYATSGARPFLYFTRFNYRNCRQTPDRDLLRVRLAVTP